MHLHMHTWVSRGLWARAFQSGAEMNRRCGSRTVLTGSLGTIALTDPSDWVHMRIKTLSLPLSEFFLFPFSLCSCSPLRRSLSLSLTLPPLTRSPFYVSPLPTVPLLLPPFLLPSYFFLFFPQLSLPLSVFAHSLAWGGVGSLLLIRSGSQNICLSSLPHLSSGSPRSHLYAPAQWSWTGNFEVRVLHSAVFKSQTLALPDVIWEFFCYSPSVVQLTFSDSLNVGCHHLVSVAATAGCGVIEFMTELGAPCWSCCCAFFIELDWYCFLKADTGADVLDLINRYMMFLRGYSNKKIFLNIYLVCIFWIGIISPPLISCRPLKLHLDQENAL